jgi:hypothetical protein
MKRRLGFSTRSPMKAQTLLLAAGIGTLVALAPQRTHAQASSVPDTAEAYLSLRAPGAGEVVITALFADSAVFLPIGELFEQLHIDYAYDAASRVINGFYLHQDDRYEIDLSDLSARRERGGPVTISANEIVVAAAGVYLAPAVFERLFALDAEVDLRELTLRVAAGEPLPGEQLAERQRERARAGLPEALQPHAPLRFPRQSHLLKGGALQYTLSASHAADAALFAADLAAATELLGGDLQASYQKASAASSPGRFDGRWRYVFGEENALLQQVQLGSLTSRTLHGLQVDGARVTNEPVNARTTQGTYLVVGTTRPNWEVELRLNGELIAFGPADERGRFRFDVPLSYGGSLVTLKYYGPSGEVIVEERRIEVPPVLVPRGVLEYDLSGGRVESIGRTGAQGRVHYGVTDWLTTGIGVEHVAYDGRRPAFYATTALRLPKSFTVALETAPGYLHRGTLQGAFPSLAYLFVSATRAANDALYNPTAVRQRVTGRTYIPVQLMGAPLGFTLAGELGEHWAGGANRDAHLDVMLNLPRFKPSIGYIVSRYRHDAHSLVLAERLNVGLFTAPTLRGRAGRLLGNALFDLAAEYDLARGGWHLLRLEAARSISQSARAAISIEHSPALNENHLELRYQLDVTAFRASTSARSELGSVSVAQTLRGAVFLDEASGRIDVSARDQIGRAGATFRMYFDENADGAFTPGEPVIPGGAVRFRESASVRATRGGLLRAEDLVAYRRYTVHVDPSQLPNPLWLPQFDSFSFVSEPNSFKIIDIPFYAGGVVEGRIADSRQPAQVNLGGLRVQLRPLGGATPRTVTTFSDGTFYVMGVPPGEYEAVLEAAQLQRLDRGIDLPARRFTVRALPEGDSVEGINFQLQ